MCTHDEAEEKQRRHGPRARRRTLDPVTQWPRTAAPMPLGGFFFMAIYVWEMNQYMYGENGESANDTSTCLTVTDRREFDANSTI